MVDCRRAVEAAEELTAESEKPALKLEVGKKYVMRNGTVTDPLEDSNGYTHCGTSYPFRDPKSCNTYQESGRYSVTTEDREDLIEEYVDPAAESERPALKLEVGKKYVTREGSVSGPVHHDGTGPHPFSAHVAQGYRSYTPEGRWSTDPSLDTAFDFVSEYVEPGPPTEGPAVCTFNLEPDEQPAIRTFETGATRNLDTNKLDYEGFLSPLVLHSFAKYMHSHRLQKDGTMRDSDNWQAGLPMDVYMKSMWRHFMDVWMLHRGQIHPVSPDSGEPVSLEEALCAVLFNVQGMLHEHLKGGA